MKLTFAIPFYSTPEFLEAAIQSVLAQTTSDWRLIVVDDRSPYPQVKQQVESYNDNRISYHLNDKNLGQSGNWNRCLELATTELVTILHADDMLQPNYAATMLKAFISYPDASAIFCRSQVIDGQARKIFTFPDFYKRFLVPSSNKPFVVQGEIGLLSLIRGNYIMCPTLCYQRSQLCGEYFSPDFKCAPDLDFTSRLLIAGGKIVGLPTIAFAYRRHEESGTAVFRKSRQQFEEEIRLLDLISSRAGEASWSQAAIAAKRKNIVKLRLTFFGLRDFFTLQFRACLDKFALASKVILGT